MHFPNSTWAASVDAAVRSDSASLGRIDWPPRYRTWHPHYAPYKSLADLPPDKESTGGTAAARA